MIGDEFYAIYYRLEKEMRVSITIDFSAARKKRRMQNRA